MKDYRTYYERGFMDKIAEADEEAWFTPPKFLSAYGAASIPQELANFYGRGGNRAEILSQKEMRRMHRAAELLAGKKGGIKTKITQMIQPQYDPKTHAVVLPTRGTGTHAHELGHAVGMKGKFPIIQRISRNLAIPVSVGGTLTAAWSDDPTVRNVASVAAPVAMAPTIAEELRASNIGRKLLQRRGVKGLKTLAPFRGVPTYLAAAVAPFIAAQVRGRLLKKENDE